LWYARITSSPANSPCEPGVRLQRHPVEPGDLGQPVLQIGEELVISLGLVERREGMQPPEAGPRHRKHFRGRVELHGTGAERDHRRGERQVSRLEPADIPEHLGLGAMGAEDRMGEIRRGAGVRGRNGARTVGGPRRSDGRTDRRRRTPPADPGDPSPRWSRRARHRPVWGRRPSG
jgi:hypothetical protein